MYNSIIKYLDQHRLKEGLTQLKSFVDQSGDSELSSKVEEMQQNYQYLLHYAAQNTKDIQRDMFIQDLTLRCYEIADFVNFTQKLKDGYGPLSDLYRQYQCKYPKTYHEIGEELRQVNEDIAMNQLLHTDDATAKVEALEKEHEELVDELFNMTWCSRHWTQRSYDEAENLHLQVKNSFDTEVFIIAITLSLLNFFDSYKLFYLINTYFKVKDIKLKSKMLVGVVLSVYYYEDRIKKYPNVMLNYDFLCSQKDFADQLNTIQGFFLLSRETEKIKKKMQEDLFPKIIKSPYMQNTDLKISEIDLNELEEKNPEWGKELNEVTQRLSEISDLQRRGADTFMATFSQLKSFSFFNKASHWFYPFNPNVSEIAKIYKEKIGNEKTFLNAMLNSTSFCNSDKYSFCLALKQFPTTTETMNNANTDSLSGQQYDELFNKMEGQKFEWSVRQYIQDLYRFFKLWRYRQQQHDIFSDSLTFWKCQTLFEHIPKNKFQKMLSQYLFENGYMDEAAEIYSNLLTTGDDTLEVNQKLGYIFQKNKDFNEAIERYQRAEELMPNQAWNLKHLAQCYKRVKNFGKALEYFMTLEKMEPDNLQIPLQIGQCLAAQRKYEEALSYFFKVEYLGKSSINVRRSIGWCRFMTGKFDEACQIYKQLVKEPEAEMEDWLNLGHTYLACKNIKEAIEPYRRAESYCKTHDDFVNVFYNDRNALRKQGISDQDIYITLDIL